MSILISFNSLEMLLVVGLATQVEQDTSIAENHIAIPKSFIA
jgi:hypothetical protein